MAAKVFGCLLGCFGWLLGGCQGVLGWVIVRWLLRCLDGC